MLQSGKIEVTVSGMHSIYIPDEIAGQFLEKGFQRVQVIASFEGRSLRFHAALQKWKGRQVITFGQKNQKALGVFPNDYFEIQLTEDHSRYGVELPEELEAVLEGDPEALELFEGFTDGKKRSIIYMIARYATSQTRIDKSLLLCTNLKKGIRKTADLLKLH